MLILLTVTFFKGSSKPIFTLPASTRAILHKGKMRYLKKKKKRTKGRHETDPSPLRDTILEQYNYDLTLILPRSCTSVFGFLLLH